MSNNNNKNNSIAKQSVKSQGNNTDKAYEAASMLRKTGKNRNAVQNAIKGELNSDIGGSYTGTPHDGGTPEQDADDL